MKKIIRVLIGIAVIMVVFFIFLYSGIYNIGANSPHFK